MRTLGLLLLLVVGAVGLQAQDRSEARHRAIANALQTTRMERVSYEDVDFTVVVRDIARLTQSNIVVDRRALADLEEDDRVITLELSDMRAGNVLNIVLDQVGLVKSYRSGILFLTTAERRDAVTVARVYDIRDITVRIQDFPAPDIRLREGDNQGPAMRWPREDDQPTADDIVDMIEDQVRADWGGTASLRVTRGQLVVRAPQHVQVEVARLLAQLRAAR
jgi:hypothetical protein